MKQTKLPWSSPGKSAAKAEDASTASPLQIRKSFSQVWSDPGGEEALEVDEEILEESLQEGLQSKRKWESKGLYRRATGGRLSCKAQGLQPRGTAGGWGSNRLYAGMERRRTDCSAAEGVDLCQKGCGHE